MIEYFKMNTRNIFIANRLREVLLNGKWIANTNFKEQIDSVTWQQATLQFGDLNTIAKLTFHINYYLEGVLHVLNGGPLEIRDQYSFDLPEIKTEADWLQLVTTFTRSATLFADKVETIPDEMFDQVFVEEKYSTYIRNFEGIIEHAYYHLGQVVLIRKLVV